MDAAMKAPLEIPARFSRAKLAVSMAMCLPILATTVAVAVANSQTPQPPQPSQLPQISHPLQAQRSGYIEAAGERRAALPSSPLASLPETRPAVPTAASMQPAVSSPPALSMPLASVQEMPPPSATPQALHFSNPEIRLTPQERAALDLAKKWKAGASTQGVKPVVGADGAIRFLFGATQPSIVCAVLQVCDVELQPGEQVNSLHLGDTARWTVEPAVTGSGKSEVQHLIIKPMDTGLETSLIVTTDRRTYHLRLRSHRTEFMPRVAFTYPEDAMAKWEQIKKQEQTAYSNQVMPTTGEYLGNLDFDYTIEGKASGWKPLRVYNDGVKTIIQMPSTMNQAEAPVLLVVRKDGGLFTDEESVQVNYRLQNDRFIVDSIFDKAILVAGVGSSQDRVMIRRGR